MNSPVDKRTSIPQLLLEQWRLGELSKPQQEALLHEFGEVAIQHALKRLEAEEAKYQPPRMAVADLTQRRRSQSMRWQRVWPWLLAASILLTVFAQRYGQTETPLPDNILLKGDSQPLLAYRHLGDKVVKVQNDELLHEGDLIQLAYEAGPYAYGAIASIDGNGHLTWFFPQDEKGDGRLQQGQRVLLQEAYKLDNAPKFERFFLVRSLQPIDRARLAEKLQQLVMDPKASLEENAWDVFSFSIRK